MSGVTGKSFNEPDERRTPPNTVVDLVRLPSGSVGRATFQPGWRWSTDVKPIVGGDACQVHHLGVCISGQIEVRHDDGTVATAGPGDAYEIEPGHDAWVVGDEPFVGYEFDSTTVETFAKSAN